VGEDIITGTKGTFETLVENFNGNVWTVVATPHPSAARLFDVSCVGSIDCWAVGFRNDRGTRGQVHHTVIEHRVAGRWVIVGSTIDDAELSGVTCVSAHNCWAVGAHSTYPSQSTLAEQYT
jgi:hypothetical protein